MSRAQTSRSAPVELTREELLQVSGGRSLGPNGIRADTLLEAKTALSNPNTQVMVIVDGVIMNKDELGMI